MFIIYKLGNPFLATGGFDTAQMRFGPQWDGLVGPMGSCSSALDRMGSQDP
jgi:hypothetical protein